ncbi:bifunctional 4-hydroxy-2-oxoglutarate aldolase/2-dehydro-3-deoxy-phosphogluconate aldolase [Pseudokordiimonas caeni]|uniref:bifunctional 4-hydroxy-2-oxoglutarate aldolase/2-dehydro-3-deoxy-phosphogluconate aldolase n=1 Tax=Pseudokordiimonas caeni TaxID=2997908 RepID=UPI002810D23A|nr:bifunctional 4-hydroxy-2-oxoglutarate aldolase/2-dehydro-3-deoxy-phosphogluconate aldolase [Pseudokordiimonas caeni]
MTDIKTIMTLAPVIPVLNYKSAEEAVAVSKALYDNGLKVLEITLRHPSALESISAVAKALPDAVVGAGTVLTPELAKQAKDAGAVFGVSPGLTETLADAVKALGFDFLPGVATLSEAMQAREWGFSELKFFPAEVAGGVPFLKAVGSVLPDLTFCPTGGVTEASAPSYLALDNVAVVGGSWLTPRGSDGKIDPAAVGELAKSAVAKLGR